MNKKPTEHKLKKQRERRKRNVTATQGRRVRYQTKVRGDYQNRP